MVPLYFDERLFFIPVPFVEFPWSVGDYSHRCDRAAAAWSLPAEDAVDRDSLQCIQPASVEVSFGCDQSESVIAS